MKRNEQRLADLRESSSNVTPLKLRRMQPTKPTTVVSLCDWADEEVGEDQHWFTDSHLCISEVR